jgi:F-type H+-transporting ATPase subunit gamma
MAGKLKAYKEKIDGFKKFYGIVSTIKKVALSKFRIMKNREKTRDSTQRYTKKIFDQMEAFDMEEEDYIKACQGKILYLPICTNRGNCGPINSALYKYVEQCLDQAGKNATIFSIGKKGFDSLTKKFPDNHTFMTCLNDDKQMKSFAWSAFVLEHLDEYLTDVERVQIIFWRYVSAGSQRQAVYNIPTWDKWLEHISGVANAAEPAADSGKISNYRLANAIMDMEEEDVKDFYAFHKNIAFLNAAGENELSESAARIIAVEGQLTNIKELLEKYTLVYNKTRQGCVTAALMEIISAKVALEDAEAGSGIAKSKFWEKTATA